MSRTSVRVVRSSVRVKRPVGVAILASAGVILGIILALVSMALIAYKVMLGIPLALQMIDLAFAIVVPFTIVWFFWGLWEVLQSAWWSHIIGGPLAVAGLGAAFVWRDTIIGLLVRGLPVTVHPWVGTGFVWSVWVVLILEMVTVIYLLTARKTFGVGAPKPLWQQRRLR
ncbi:MAG: hypothetical protein NZ699_04440 [Roseiflexus sp.]|nr:hypothetical protein [Roseiflexus sp.]MCS7288362.1 hypothetical protein [Roseiflexus sp.]MDW8146512.1 hypothetical protein [Roseiflexaceae bacterium]MDW8231209.1 hypothetical protein [Roseiflexaceae bacterium]